MHFRKIHGPIPGPEMRDGRKTGCQTPPCTLDGGKEAGRIGGSTAVNYLEIHPPRSRVIASRDGK
jgi:hypothetical protein